MTSPPASLYTGAMEPGSGEFILRGDALPADATVTRYEAREYINLPYRVDIDFYSLDASFDVLDAMRTSICLTVINEHGQTRNYHGIVERAEFDRSQSNRFYFRIQLRPALAAFAHRENCRIFQDRSVPDVMKILFDEAGFGDTAKWDVVATYEPREYIVQYRESELNFVTRWFEQVGLFYFFEHSEEGHKLIVGDNPEAFVLLDAPPVEFSAGEMVGPTAQALDALERTRSLRTTTVHLKDYDFEKPEAKPEGLQPFDDLWPMPYYDYPGGFVAEGEGEVMTKARLRALRHDGDLLRGRSRAIDLRVGSPFLVEGAEEPDLNGEFIVVELVSRGRQDPSDASKNTACENEFVAIPKGTDYAAPRRARWPRIRGLQTAVVTGQDTSDQAVHVDEYGRIKLRFFWDRVSPRDDTSSCWIRVSQVPLGGSMILPRVGWEMSVAFLEGDPDRPVCLGRLYNAERPPPQALPGASASGSLKSMSYPNGAGFNEIGASDTGGSQGFSITAQKDLNITTGNDWSEEVGVDDTQNVTKNVSNSVSGDDTATIGGNQNVDVGAHHSHKISGSQTISVGGNDDSNSTADTQETIGGSRTYTVSGNQITICNAHKVTVDGNITKTVGAVQISASVASIADNILGMSTSNVGAARVHLVAGTHGESVGGMKNQTVAAAELHVNMANNSIEAGGTLTNLIGALHYRKITGDYVVKAPMITLLGGVGDLKGGSSTLKLGGGPIVAKGSKIAFNAAMVVRTGATLKEA